MWRRNFVFAKQVFYARRNCFFTKPIIFHACIYKSDFDKIFWRLKEKQQHWYWRKNVVIYILEWIFIFQYEIIIRYDIIDIWWMKQISSNTVIDLIILTYQTKCWNIYMSTTWHKKYFATVSGQKSFYNTPLVYRYIFYNSLPNHRQCWNQTLQIGQSSAASNNQISLPKHVVLCQCCMSLDYSTFSPQWPLLLTWFNFNPSMDK